VSRFQPPQTPDPAGAALECKAWSLPLQIRLDLAEWPTFEAFWCASGDPGLLLRIAWTGSGARARAAMLGLVACWLRPLLEARGPGTHPVLLQAVDAVCSREPVSAQQSGRLADLGEPWVYGEADPGDVAAGRASCDLLARAAVRLVRAPGFGSAQVGAAFLSAAVGDLLAARPDLAAGFAAEVRREVHPPVPPAVAAPADGVRAEA
jgi:hypothetical protein